MDFFRHRRFYEEEPEVAGIGEGVSPKAINDTIHGVIHVDGAREELLSTPEFNKLSHIKQLGLAHLVFPGAHHTRFEHSLGVSHLGSKMADSVGLDAHEKKLVETAAMLHDVGHGPYSHTLEHILHSRGGMDHMTVTEGIITGEYDVLREGEQDVFSERMSVPEIIEKHDMDPKDVANLIRGPDAGGSERNLLYWTEGSPSFQTVDQTLGHLVHGPVDCDQMDYLLRDAHFTGVKHGIIDHERLIACMERHADDVAVTEGGLSALEGMMMARGLMYSAVYFHRVTRITELMLSRAVERMEGVEVEPVDMQRMVDSEIWQVLDQAGDFSRDMLRRIKYRQMLKIAVSRRRDDFEVSEVERLVELAENSTLRQEIEAEIAGRAGIPEGYVALDVPSVKLLLSEPRMAEVDIRIIGDDGVTRWFAEHTPIADALRERQVSQSAMYVATLPQAVDKVSEISERVIFA